MSDIWRLYESGNHNAVLEAAGACPEILHVAGLSLIGMGRFDEANTLLIASGLVHPHATHFANACIAFLEADQPDLALPFAVTGLSEFPDDPNLIFNAGNVYSALGELDAARDHFLRAFSLRPSHWEAAMNLANTLRRQGLLTHALQFYEAALKSCGDNHTAEVQITLNHAVTLTDLGRYEEALAAFDGLAARRPIDSPEMDFNRATLRLKLGDYREGWKLYLRRWDCEMAASDVAMFEKPILTKLSDGVGKRVLLCHEQGFGDGIQFIRYAPLLEQAGLNITVLCPAPLARLFERNRMKVVTSREGLDYDFECPMLNAPYLLGTTLETIPAKVPYLTTGTRPMALPGSGLRVGIVWAGQSRDALEMKLMDEKRSIPIDLLAPLAEVPGVTFFNLQHGERQHEADGAPIPLMPLLPEDGDFLTTAECIRGVNLVITVDTAVAHMAAALGIETWVLSRYDGCWRWLQGRDDSPWYPGRVRLFHQTRPGSWDEPIQAVKAALASRAG